MFVQIDIRCDPRFPPGIINLVDAGKSGGASIALEADQSLCTFASVYWEGSRHEIPISTLSELGGVLLGSRDRHVARGVVKDDCNFCFPISEIEHISRFSQYFGLVSTIVLIPCLLMFTLYHWGSENTWKPIENINANTTTDLIPQKPSCDVFDYCVDPIVKSMV
jgi:hypothetical protein